MGDRRNDFEAASSRLRNRERHYTDIGARLRNLSSLYQMRQRNTDWFNEYIKDKCCIRCGIDDPDLFEFHHRNPREKAVTISNALFHYGLERLKAEVEKCDILCANCHRKLHKVKGWQLLGKLPKSVDPQMSFLTDEEEDNQ